jgi:hypothetical protein
LIIDQRSEYRRRGDKRFPRVGFEGAVADLVTEAIEACPRLEPLEEMRDVWFVGQNELSDCEVCKHPPCIC